MGPLAALQLAAYLDSFSYSLTDQQPFPLLTTLALPFLGVPIIKHVDEVRECVMSVSDIHLPGFL